MVDAEDLLFVEFLVQDPVQLARRLEVAAEGLLDHDLRSLDHLGLREPRHDQRVPGRRRRAVEEPASLGALVLVGPLEVLPEVLHRVLAVELAGNVGQTLHEVLPLLAGRLAPPELLHRLRRVLVELLVLHLGPRVSHDGEPVRQEPLHEQVPERRDQLSPREI